MDTRGLSRGIICLAIGEVAYHEYILCKAAIQAHNPELPITVIDSLPGSADMTNQQASRWAKVNLDRLSPYDLTLYLDADTRPCEDLSIGFDMLEDGCDLVIAPSENQGDECLWHVGERERAATFDYLGYVPLQLQAGVFYFRKSPEVARLFAAWRDEWQRYKDQDQAALLRALRCCPVRINLLGRPWNGGEVVRHFYGRCRG